MWLKRRYFFWQWDSTVPLVRSIGSDGLPVTKTARFCKISADPEQRSLWTWRTFCFCVGKALERWDGGGEIYYPLWRSAWRVHGPTRSGLDKQPCACPPLAFSLAFVAWTDQHDLICATAINKQMRKCFAVLRCSLWESETLVWVALENKHQLSSFPLHS